MQVLFDFVTADAAAEINGLICRLFSSLAADGAASVDGSDGLQKIHGEAMYTAPDSAG